MSLRGGLPLILTRLFQQQVHFSVAMCCSVLQCVAVWCKVVQCVADSTQELPDEYSAGICESV